MSPELVETLLQNLHRQVYAHSKRAISMWLEAGRMLESGGPDPLSLNSVLELNRRAIEHCDAALRVIRYIQEIPVE